MLDLVLVRLRPISSISRRFRPAWWKRRRIGMDKPGGRGRWIQSMLGLNLIMSVNSIVAFAWGLLIVGRLRCEGSTRRLVLHKHMTSRCVGALSRYLLRGDAGQAKVHRSVRVHMGVPLGHRVRGQFPAIVVVVMRRRARCSGLREEGNRLRTRVLTGLRPVSVGHGVQRSVRHSDGCIISGVGQRRLAGPC